MYDSSSMTSLLVSRLLSLGETWIIDVFLIGTISIESFLTLAVRYSLHWLLLLFYLIWMFHYQRFILPINCYIGIVMKEMFNEFPWTFVLRFHRSYVCRKTTNHWIPAWMNRDEFPHALIDCECWWLYLQNCWSLPCVNSFFYQVCVCVCVMTRSLQIAVEIKVMRLKQNILSSCVNELEHNHWLLCIPYGLV